MKIAIISDIHENFHNLSLFFNELDKYEIKKIIFLWDFINNWIAKMLASSNIPVYAIWWNNDGDKVAITKTSLSKSSNMTIWFDTYDFLEIDNRKIFITHYPLLSKPIAKSWDFDAVFYGHNHIKNIDKINNCLIVNPWEISAYKTNTASFAIYDTEANTAEIIDIEGSVSVMSDLSKEYIKNMKFNFGKSKTHKY